jgi:ABC-type polysaccharide/polyol phosphate transport system ATPase subunit
MSRSHLLHHAHDLPDDVLVSVQGVTRAVAPPDPELPKWIARLLPKSGLAGTGGMIPDVGMEDDVDEEDIEVEEDEEPAALKEISFELRRGEGLGILGPDRTARKVLFRILTGAIPPTTGMVVVRGRIAPVLRSDLAKLSVETGEKAVFLAARFLHWPRSLLRTRWREILEFAKLDELADLEPRRYRTMSTARMLLSAVLHLDVDVYLLDDSVNDDAAFAVRCLDLLEQRQREGAVVIQGSGRMMIENLARLCGEVIWLEDGGITHRGRPVEVAVAVEKAHKEELHPLSAPLAASLADPGEVEVPAEGATIDIELEVLRKNLEMTFALQLMDRHGRQTHLEQPESVRSKGPGLYRLRIYIPGGLLPDGTYETKLLAEVGVRGSEPAPARELLVFDLVSTGQDAAEAGDDGLTFELLLDDDEVGETVDDVEWRVSRTSS